MGTEHSHDKQNSGELPPRKLRRSGTCNPIRVDIFTTHHKKYGMRIRRHREASSGNLFSVHFLQKIKISHTPRSNSKFDSGQEGRTGPPKYRNVWKQKIRSPWYPRTELIWNVTGESEFYTADHLQDLREERRDGQKIHDDANNTKLRGLVENVKALVCHFILCAKHIGSWMTIWGTMVTGTVPAAT